MNVVELKVLTEDDGIASAIENNLFNLEEIENTPLYDMIIEAKELIEKINSLIDEMIEEIKKDNDDCDCNGIG